jgi:hypothetical protein
MERQSLWRFWIVVLIVIVSFPDRTYGQSRPWHRPVDGPASMGPDEAVQQLMRAVSRLDFAAVVRLLPESWKADMESVIRQSMAAYDEELMARWMIALARLDQVIRENGHNRPARPQPTDDKATGYPILESFAKTWQGLTRAGLNTREGWLKFSLVGFSHHVAKPMVEFLMLVAGSSDATVMKAALKMLAKTRCEVTGSGKHEVYGEEVTVSMTMSGSSSEELKLVRIDGMWVPLDLAMKWKELMSELKVFVDAAAVSSSTDRKNQVDTLVRFEKAIRKYAAGGDPTVPVNALSGKVAPVESQPGEPLKDRRPGDNPEPSPFH